MMAHREMVAQYKERQQAAHAAYCTYLSTYIQTDSHTDRLRSDSLQHLDRGIEIHHFLPYSYTTWKNPKTLLRWHAGTHRTNHKIIIPSFSADRHNKDIHG